LKTFREPKKGPFSKDSFVELWPILRTDGSWFLQPCVRGTCVATDARPSNLTTLPSAPMPDHLFW
jgi:hypothetical protein